MPFIIYVNTESLLEKISSSEKNSEKLSTTKITQHTSCGCSLFTYSSFDGIKNKHSFYRSGDCMTKFCAGLGNYATKITHCEENERMPLTKKQDRKCRK